MSPGVMSIFSSISSRPRTSTRVGWSSRRRPVRVVATTTTSSVTSGGAVSSTMTCNSPSPTAMSTVAGRKPSLTTVTCAGPGGRASVAVPEASVPVSRPATVTTAPATGAPSLRTSIRTATLTWAPTHTPHMRTISPRPPAASARSYPVPALPFLGSVVLNLTRANHGGRGTGPRPRSESVWGSWGAGTRRALTTSSAGLPARATSAPTAEGFMATTTRDTTRDTTPYWTTSATIPQFAELAADATADVVVVGGGITGLTAAYLLRAGRRRVHRARTRTLCPGRHRPHQRAPDDGDRHPAAASWRSGSARSHAQAVWDAGLAAHRPDRRASCGEHDIDADFEWVDGYLHAPRRRPTRRRTETPARRRGAGRVRWASTRSSSRRCRSPDGPGMRFAEPGPHPSAQVSRRAGDGARRARRPDPRAQRGRRVLPMTRDR